MVYSFTSCAAAVVRAALVVVIQVVASPPGVAAGQRQADGPPQCRAAGPLVRIPELPEVSGIAASRRVPGRFWTHNDSGEPVLVALDARGSVTGRLRLTGATAEDWEAIAVGPCPAGSCLFVADIGDNDARRRRVTIYRVPEPSSAGDAVTGSDAFHVTYPDGPQDAESLLVTPDGRLHIVTKGETGPIALYRFPSDLRPGASVQLERVGGPRGSGGADDDHRITDGAVSPDGAWIVLRTTRALVFYSTPELMTGNWREAARLDLTGLREPQGEGVTFGADNTIYLAGEGGGRSQPGTFARLACTPHVARYGRRSRPVSRALSSFSLARAPSSYAWA